MILSTPRRKCGRVAPSEPWAVPHSLTGVVIGDVHQRRRRTPLCCGRRLHLRRPHTCLRSQRMQVGRCTHTRKRPIPTWADPHLGRSHVARFVSGLGIGGATPIVFPYAAEAVPPKARGFYVSVGAIHAHSHAFTCAHVRTFRRPSARYPIQPGPSLDTWADPTWADPAWVDPTWADPTWADPTWADLTRATQVSRCSGRSAQFSPRSRTPSSSVARTPQRGPCLRFSRRPLRWQCAPVRSARMVCGARCVIGACAARWHLALSFAAG